MTRQKKPKAAAQPEVAYRDGQSALESLPMPLVHYPGFYGAFFAFSTQQEPDRLYLCSCSEPAVVNYVQLATGRPQNAIPHKHTCLSSSSFPLAIATASLGAADPLAVLEFKDGICHRCNLARPALDYCHPMYGGQFMRGYGWYVKQAFYRLGVSPRGRWAGTGDNPIYLGHAALSTVCPPDLAPLLDRDREIAMAFRLESDRLTAMASGPRRPDIPDDEEMFWSNVTTQDATEYVRLRTEAAHVSRAISKYVEDLVRQEFGFRKVGEGWVSETLLAAIVGRLLPGVEVIRHHRPKWLEGLELDIYVPSLNLGIEYQGQQHFHAIDAWGGSAALASVQERDARKAAICEAQGVTLITVDYTEPLTEAHVAMLLSSAHDGESA